MFRDGATHQVNHIIENYYNLAYLECLKNKMLAFNQMCRQIHESHQYFLYTRPMPWLKNQLKAKNYF